MLYFELHGCFKRWFPEFGCGMFMIAYIRIECVDVLDIFLGSESQSWIKQWNEHEFTIVGPRLGVSNNCLLFLT